MVNFMKFEMLICMVILAPLWCEDYQIAVNEPVEIIEDLGVSGGHLIKKTVGYQKRNTQTGEITKTGTWTVTIKGLLISSETFNDEGRRHGEAISYYENGQISRRTIFNNGVYDGVMQQYLPSGILIGSISYKNGVLDGDQVEMDMSGKIVKSTTYVNGKVKE